MCVHTYKQRESSPARCSRNKMKGVFFFFLKRREIRKKKRLDPRTKKISFYSFFLSRQRLFDTFNSSHTRFTFQFSISSGSGIFCFSSSQYYLKKYFCLLKMLKFAVLPLTLLIGLPILVCGVSTIVSNYFNLYNSPNKNNFTIKIIRRYGKLLLVSLQNVI